MLELSAVHSALDRNVRAVTLRPSVGRGTAKTVARLGEGLACAIEDGAWTLSAGMHEKYGGTNSGPNPGVLGRAALASCLAIGYAMWAARLEVPIDTLAVEVEADYDVRGELGVDDEVTPAYLEIRYRILIGSPASDEVLRQLCDTADRYSAYRTMYAEPIPLRREIVRAPSSGS